VLEALILTAGVVASLTAYAFWAAKKGKEFGYLGPILFSGLTILVLTSFIQVMTMVNSKRTSKKTKPYEQSTYCNNYCAVKHCCRFSFHWDLHQLLCLAGLEPWYSQASFSMTQRA
jgi:hypothetical protein